MCRFASLLTVALLILSSSPALAAGPHVVQVGAGPALHGYVSSWDDGLSEAGELGVSPTLLVGYAYAFSPYFSVGADLSWCRLLAAEEPDGYQPPAFGDLFRIPLVLRGTLPLLDGDLRLSLGLQAGLGVLRNGDGDVIPGWTAGGLLEASYFLTENLGLFLRADGLIGFQSREKLRRGQDYVQSVYTISLAAGLALRF